MEICMPTAPQRFLDTEITKNLGPQVRMVFMAAVMSKTRGQTHDVMVPTYLMCVIVGSSIALRLGTMESETLGAEGQSRASVIKRKSMY